MGEDADVGGISGDSSQMLDDLGCTQLDRVAQLPIAVMPVHTLTDLIAGFAICLLGRSYFVPWKFQFERRAEHLRERLSRLKTELRVKAERAIVISRLHQSD